MMKIQFRFIFFVLIALNISLVKFSLAFDEIPPFTKDDRVIFFAPHPDDEAIGTGGAIQKALAAGAKVQVVCLTNGDHNELAFIFFERRITFRKGEFLHMGEVRRKETVKAMSEFGLNSTDIIFLGYPDFGTMEIFTKYWNAKRPFKNSLTRVTKVAYNTALSYEAPYVGESILSDFKKVIFDFKPTKIFVTNTADTNRDHRACYLFLQVALWDLTDKIKIPEIFPYMIHVVGWPMPRGYHPDLSLLPPEQFKSVDWRSLALTPDEIKKKYDAIMDYKSQIKYNPPYLLTFARKNELFGTPPPVRLNKQKTPEIHWYPIGVLNDDISIEEKENRSGSTTNLFYAYYNQDICIRLDFKRPYDKNLGTTMFLCGYRKKEKFAEMPKLRISTGLLGLRIKNKKQPIFIKDAVYTSKGEEVIVKIPLASLDNPDYILCAVHAAGLSQDQTAWRVIEFK